MSNSSLEITLPSAKEPVIVDSEKMGVSVISFGATDNSEALNVVVQEWYDEQGEDAYIPTTGIKFKAYDLSVKCGAMADKTENATTKKNAFINRLSSAQVFEIANKFIGRSWKGCYLKGVKDEETTDTFVVFTLTFRVTEP